MNLEAKKKALRRIVHGVYVVGVANQGQLNAFTATWLTQVSFEPPLVVVGVRADGISHKMIEASGVFVVNFLTRDQKPLAQHFLKPAHLDGKKMDEIPHRLGQTSAPILEEAAAFVECKVRQIYKEGDHSIVVGEVIEAGVQSEAEPLTLKETGWNYGG